MPTVTSESTDNLVSGHESSGEGSKEKTVSQCFLQSRDNCIAVRHHNPLPEPTNRTVTHKALERKLFLLLPYFSYLGGFFRVNRAKIAKIARPPLRPAPIEKPFAEATRILRSFSRSFAGTASMMEPSADDAVEGAAILAWSLAKPLISLPEQRWSPPWSAEDGDIESEAVWVWVWGELISKSGKQG